MNIVGVTVIILFHHQLNYIYIANNTFSILLLLKSN